MLLLCMLMWGPLDGAPIWKIEQTGIFKPIGESEVVVSEDGRIYLLNSGEFRVQIYSKEGELLKTFGKKGAGPGEFSFPANLFLKEGFVYVRDYGNHGMHQFDLDGKFVKLIRIEGYPAGMLPVENGWVYGNWRVFGTQNDLGELILVDENFENPVTLVTMRKPNTPKQKSLNISLDEAMPYNPAPERPLIAVKSGGHEVWLVKPGRSFKISVIDTRKKEVVRTITKDWTRIPFNEEWGNGRIKERNENKPTGGFQLKLKANFPDYFPHLQAMTYREGHFFLDKWTAMPEKQQQTVVLDSKGEDAKSPFSMKDLHRSMAFTNGRYLIFTYDNDEGEAGMALVSRDQAKAYMDTNPIVFHEEGSGVILLSD